MDRKIPRVLGIVILASMVPPVVYYSVRYIKEPVLYAGDKIETRTCRDCGGYGKIEGMEEDNPMIGDRCPACGGKGTVQVIIPGPNRQTRIWGVVVDLEEAGEELLYTMPENLRYTPVQTALMPDELRNVKGAIPNVKVTLVRDGGEAFEITSSSTGRFSQRLPPGDYTVQVNVPGFDPFEEEFEVQPLTEPIWLEEANIIREPDSFEDAQGTNGLIMIMALAKGGEEGAFLRVSPGF
ncbi:MAG: carboxypeptidase regulatory-like domain-containing protein [Planctomycetes bacterium]|nr:carboxypeptidase regulatory-like domain-containing protein [Planctomycetota bacterium]